MNRRNFLKNIGKGAAGAAVIATVGSEVVEAMSAIPVYEDAEYNYYWYNEAVLEARQRFEERLEMMRFEGGVYEAKTEFEEQVLSNHPHILKEKYEVTGSDMSEIKWVRVKKNRLLI